MNGEMKKLDGMENSRSKRNAHHVMVMSDAHESNLSHDVVCNQVCRKRNETNWITARTFTSRVNVHVRCVEGALGLGGHVVSGVVLSFTTQTQYQV